MKEFLIEHLDPLAQGVYKEEDNIYFIPKTLPQETGTFEILKKKKGVHFGKLINLSKQSEIRAKPQCLHFADCPGCHYLHTGYKNELAFKQAAMERLFQKFDLPEIKIWSSQKRLNYRNRIQLHYDRNSLGFVDARSKKIINVPNCLIFTPELQPAFNELQSSWKRLRLVLNQPANGHVELYYTKGNVLVEWNKRYASGGFTQVNTTLNQNIVNHLADELASLKGGLLDLFGGNGNLSSKIDFDYRLCVDLYDQPNKEQFSLNLHQKDCLESFLEIEKRNFNTFLIDPPRSGFKDLYQWVSHFKPEQIFYMSCGPQTQVNDIRPLIDNYEISQAHLIDFFPATHHYETLIAMRKRQTQL